jgi:outer membrane lipoprotein LolB
VTGAPRAFAWVLAGAFVLAGCASAPPPMLSADALAGRLSVLVAGDAAQPARSLAANFELRGDARRGALDLATPLGSILAQAGWADGQAWLLTPQGRRDFGDVDALSRELLGEAVPVAAMFDWLRGRPWPSAPSTGREAGFEQLGWQVDLSRFADAQVVAHRAAAPAVTVRAVLDRP